MAQPPNSPATSQVVQVGRAQLFENRLRASPRLSYAINHHRNIRGEKMRFDDKPYLIALFHDPHPKITVMSCVQVGKTEWLMVAAFYFAEQGLQVMYTLPDEVLRNSVVANRIDPLLKKVAYYASKIKSHGAGTDNRGLKHFGLGSIFFAGSNSSSTFIEKPLDVILADELDKFDMGKYELADDRLTASPYKIKYEVGNPTVDSWGIAQRYRESDHREWHLECKKCSFWQPLDWFENVVKQGSDKTAEYRLIDQEWHLGCGRDIKVFCRRCMTPINRLGVGKWVAKYPGRTVHGYHLHKLMAPHVTMVELWEKFRKALTDDTKLQVFYNSDLGLPFAGKGSKITDDLLNNCRADYLMPIEADACVIGVDVGKRLHVVVRQILAGEKLKMVFAGTLPGFDELHRLMERFNTVSIAIDSMPETRSVQEFISKHPYKAWMVRYQQKITDMTRDEENRVLAIDRTQAMDRVMSFFRRRAYLLPKNAQSLDRGDYYRLLKAPTRIYNVDRNAFEWIGDPDHYFHAEVYCMLAYIARGEFKVWGVNIGAGAPSLHSKPPEDQADLLKRFPPGTDPALVAHYSRLFEQMKAADGSANINGNIPGALLNG